MQTLATKVASPVPLRWILMMLGSSGSGRYRTCASRRWAGGGRGVHGTGGGGGGAGFFSGWGGGGARGVSRFPRMAPPTSPLGSPLSTPPTLPLGSPPAMPLGSPALPAALPSPSFFVG